MNKVQISTIVLGAGLLAGAVLYKPEVTFDTVKTRTDFDRVVKMEQMTAKDLQSFKLAQVDSTALPPEKVATLLASKNLKPIENFFATDIAKGKLPSVTAKVDSKQLQQLYVDSLTKLGYDWNKIIPYLQNGQDVNLYKLLREQLK